MVVPLPDSDTKLASALEQVVEQQSASLVSHAPLHLLLEKEFIEAFVKKGQLYIMSHNTRIDTQNCVALLPTGHLILHVTKDTYEQLGLEGKPSRYSSKKPLKYVIDLDLKPESFAPGRKGYERAVWCLKDRLDLNFNLLISWTPHDSQICSSSVSKFFESRGLSVSPVPVSMHIRRMSNVFIPLMDSAAVVATDKACGREDFWEWVGAVASGVDMRDAAPDSFISTLSCPTPTEACPCCLVVSVTGFLTPASTSWLLNTIRNAVGSRADASGDSKTSSWASLTLHGFQDSPVSSDSREHGFFQQGDHLHSYLVFPNKDYWLYSSYGHHDLCQ